MHVVVTGSAPRTGEPDLTDSQWTYIWTVLSEGGSSITSLSQGNARGVDTIAAAWATAHKDTVTLHSFAAEWKAHGKAAGPIRNRSMLVHAKNTYGLDNTVVLAFSNKPIEQSKGTKHCLTEAERMGFRTHLFRIDEPMHKEY